MNTRKHILALGLSLAIGAGGASLALAQGGMMGDQGGYAPGTGPGMMGGQGGYGMGMGPGMMGGGMMPCPMMSGSGMGMMQQMLDTEQLSEMRELMQGHRQQQFERMEQVMDLRYDLMTEMHQTRPDPEVVKEHHARMAELHGEMMAEMVRMRNAMQDMLTEEQREKLQ